jgi:eukaryotic-like serine/threonine-protein kinase
VDSDREVAERRLGQLVGGKWRLERLIGTGGMAAVYAGRRADGASAAVKMLHPEMTLKRDVRERFVREGYVGNRVQHPGAVKIIEHGESEGEAYLVMELLEGEPLGECVRRLGGLPVPDLLGYLDQVLEVLAAAHDQGIIHRDIKPDNLFVGADGRMKILDFGLARMLDEVPGEFKTRTGLALGTMPYMAPEQALGKRDQLDGRVDLFALGASAFRILARRRVHEADSEAELLVAMATKPAPPLSTVAPDVPRNVCAIIDLSLAFSKDARYPDARTMQADVRAALAGQDPPYATARGMGAARDMPTRVEHVAPVLPASAESAPASSVPSLPSVPHAIAAGARAASTALMPVVDETALPDDPTRAEGPAARAAPPAANDLAPGSQSPASLSQSGIAHPPPSQAFAQSGYYPSPAPPAVTSRPPPPAQSALPLLLLLVGAGILLLLLVGTAVVVATLSPSEPSAAPSVAPTPSLGAPTVPNEPSEPSAVSTTDHEPPATRARAPIAGGAAKPAAASPAPAPAQPLPPTGSTAAAGAAAPRPTATSTPATTQTVSPTISPEGSTGGQAKAKGKGKNK